MYVRNHSSDFDTNPVRNYYETLVVEMLGDHTSDDLDADTLADIACVALNHLPPKYYRHDVDLAYFKTLEESEEMRQSVIKALHDAEQFIRDHRR